MGHRQVAGGLLAVVVLLLAGASQAGAASVDYFLKLDDIKGESQSEGHEHEIDVFSFSWGLKHGDAQGRSTGRVTPSSFTIMKRVDKASPLLMLGAASGQRFNCVQLTADRGDEQRSSYFVIKLEDASISELETTGGTEQLPTESVSFNYARIQYEVFPQAQDGSSGQPVTARWDFLTRKQFSTGC